MSIYNRIRTGIFKLIFPAQFLYPANSIKFQVLNDKFWRRELANSNYYQLERYQVANRGELDCARLSSQYTKNTENRYIIYACGNAECYQTYADLFAYLADQEYNVVAFNPPGVGNSLGSCNGPEDYEKAYSDIIESLHEGGVKYEDMVLFGHSLGGAIATNVAAKHQEDGHRVKLINDRSFANLAETSADVVCNFIKPWVLRTILQPLVRPLVVKAIRYFNLDLNPAEEFKKIIEKNPGDAIALIDEKDGIVRYDYSLAKTVKPESRLDIHIDSNFQHIKHEPHNIMLHYMQSKKNNDGNNGKDIWGSKVNHTMEQDVMNNIEKQLFPSKAKNKQKN